MAFYKTENIYFDYETLGGVITASLSNRNGVCIKVPRSVIARNYSE